MPSSNDLGQLGDAAWERLQGHLDRFESAWENAETVDLAVFLPPSDDPLRAVALIELIKSDLEIRWVKGQVVFLEAYAERFSELGGAAALSPQLIYEEFRVRHSRGDRPDLAIYRMRFPNQFIQFKQLLDEQPNKGAGSKAPAPPAANAADELSLPSTFTELFPVGGGCKPIKRLGVGGFGEVWRAEAPGGVEVAVKIILRPLDHEEAKRELESLELIKNLRHPFLLQTHTFAALPDRLLIQMELADGSLRDRLRECRGKGLPGIPAAELIAYFREAAEAIDYLHSCKIHHSDIKPDNILLIGRHAKIGDFGLARVMRTSLLASATGSGSPPYMPPELWRGKVSRKSDQYSFAATYAELRLNRRLFASKELMDLMLDHLERPPDLQPLPEPEQAVLKKALAKTPSERFSDCRAFVAALEEACRGTNELGGATSQGVLPETSSWVPMAKPRLAPPAGSQPLPPTPARSRRRILFGVFGAIAIAAAVVAVVMLQSC